MNASRIWILGTVVLCLGILLLGWFAAVQPQLISALAAEVSRAEVESANAAHEEHLAELEEQFGSLASLEEQLEKLQRSVPPVAAMPAFVDELHALAAASGVSVREVTVADPQPYGAASTVQETAEEPAAGDDAATGESAAPSEAPAQPAAAPAVPTTSGNGITAANFILIPVTVTVEGSYSTVLSFVKSAQNGERLFLVNSLTVQPVDAANIGAGAAYNAVLGGFVYVLVE